MIVHLIDGTYELFRHFYGLRRFNKGKDKPFGAIVGVLNGVLEMIEEGATHLGVATDQVIESFRNNLWHGYKTGEGIEPVLLSQFHPLEDALVSMGVVVWPMIELEADDALASAAYLAAADSRVLKVCIWTPDKDLGQCVCDDRVVQIDRRAKTILNANMVHEKFAVRPTLIPDLLALVGDSADGYPGIPGIGKVGAARLLNTYGPIEAFPKSVLGKHRRWPYYLNASPLYESMHHYLAMLESCNGEDPRQPSKGLQKNWVSRVYLSGQTLLLQNFFNQSKRGSLTCLYINPFITPTLLQCSAAHLEF